MYLLVYLAVVCFVVVIPENIRVFSLLFGSACWARTSDPLINSQLLYQLS